MNRKYGDVLEDLSEVKDISRKLVGNVLDMGAKITDRVSLEAESKLIDLRLKIFSSVLLTLAATYAAFWIFASVALWLSPAVPLVYSVSGIAVIHVVLALVLLYYAQKPITPDKGIVAGVEKSKEDMKTIFNDMSHKTMEIKEIANVHLNPILKIKRHPEAFIIGSFAAGVALSVFKPFQRSDFVQSNVKSIHN